MSIEILNPADWHLTPTEKRPWGEFTVLYEDDKCKIKKITVNPGCRLSLQSHARRREYWKLISGNWEVELYRFRVDSEKYHQPIIIKSSNIDEELGVCHNVFIYKNDKHRVKNVTNDPLVFIEIQQGEYFGEDDIIRYEDDYNRV